MTLQRLLPSAVLCALVAALAALSAGCGEDAPEGPASQVRWSCGGSQWSAEAGQARFYRCDGTAGDWRCACDLSESRTANGSDPASSQDSCEAALDAVCGVDARLVAACGEADEGVVGRCWPTLAGDAVSPDTFACACAGDTAPTDVEASSCEAALATRCQTSCQDDLGDCQPTADYGVYSCTCVGEDAARDSFGPTCQTALERACDPQAACAIGEDSCQPNAARDGYACTCGSYYDASRQMTAPDCETALDAACNPRGEPGWAGCNDWSGFCDRSAEGTWQCACTDATSGWDTAEACDAALHAVCGSTEPPEDYFCTTGSQLVTLNCQQSVSEAGQTGYACTCKFNCPDESGATARFVTTETCQAALDAVPCSCF